MSWWNPLSWGEKAQDNILDKDNGLLTQVGSWIGNMNLTPEELLEANGKTVASVQTFVTNTLSENTVRSKTRRVIAISWVAVELGLIVLSALIAPWNTEVAKYYFSLATSDVMYMGTLAIIIFFFGSYGISRIQENKSK